MAGPKKVVAQSRGDTKVVVLEPAREPFTHGEQIDLIVTAQPAIGIVHRAPPPARRHELRRDLVGVRIAKAAEHVSGLGRHFEWRRVEVFLTLEVGRDAGKGVRNQQGGGRNGEESFHKRALP